MDKLEKFIIQNRDSLDNLEPPSQLWDGIQEIKDPTKTKSRVIALPVYKWAIRIASAIILFVASYYYHDYKNKPSSLLTSTELPEASLLSELLEAEYYYTAQINFETEKFYKVTVGNKPLRNEIQNELKNLDKEFSELKDDLMDNADNEDVIAAMIQNYRLKLSILQDIMYQLKEQKTVKKTTNETRRINI